MSELASPMTVMKALLKERNELRTQLEAWHTAFGTTQLTHAEAKLQALERERDALKVEYESRVHWIAKMCKILGYDNNDGFHSDPCPHTIAERLVAESKAKDNIIDALAPLVENKIRFWE